MPRSNLKNVFRLIDAANAELSVEQSFLSDLKRCIEMESAVSNKKPSQTYKPSSMHCIRNMYYQLIGAEPDISNSSYCSVGICNSGTDTHIRIQTAISTMKNFGIDCDYVDVEDYIRCRNLTDLEIISKSGMETKLYHRKLNMSFLCDGIIRYKGHYYIIELKTESSYKWNSRTGVDPTHFRQGTAYSIVFEIPEVIFIYVNRDILDMKSYMYVPSDDDKQSLIGLIDNCDDYVKRKICPPKPTDLSKKACEYCNYKSLCKVDRGE